MELLEYHGHDTHELMNMIFKKHGLAQLALTMRSHGRTRRLQDESGESGEIIPTSFTSTTDESGDESGDDESGDDESGEDGDEFDECDFSFLYSLINNLPTGSFNGPEDILEEILAFLLSVNDIDCESDLRDNPVRCSLIFLFEMELGDTPTRRRLDESGDDDDIIRAIFPVSIGGADDVCFNQLENAFNALNANDSMYTTNGCNNLFTPTPTDPVR